MPTNELAPEKRIADDLPDLNHPPVPDPEVLENPEPDEIPGEPPSTRLLFEGLGYWEITADLLVDLHRVTDGHGLDVEGISVRYPDPEELNPERL